jgi:hypothetical protein
VPFGLFKKKDRQDSAGEPRAVDAPTTDEITIRQAQELLQKLEDAKAQELAALLSPVRDAVASSLRELAAIADEMEKEKIKLEELEKRFGSSIENSKKTVMSALRREAGAELPAVQTAGGAKKFKERLEAAMSRFGEVSGSHSRMLNHFMKKYAGRMKDEFGVLEGLLKETKSALAGYEQERVPAVKCAGALNTIQQKLASISAGEASVRDIESRTAELEAGLGGMKTELGKMRESAEYAQAAAAAARVADARLRQEQLRKQVSEMFSHVSRALAKYSYGVSKETEKRLKVMLEEPWQVFDDPEPYAKLLQEIRKSAGSGQLQLKDAEKAGQHIEAILASLPGLAADAKAIEGELAAGAGDGGVVQDAEDLQVRIAQHEEEIARGRQAIEQQKRQLAERDAEVDSLLKQVSASLLELTGRRYAIVR